MSLFRRASLASILVTISASAMPGCDGGDRNHLTGPREPPAKNGVIAVAVVEAAAVIHHASWGMPAKVAESLHTGRVLAEDLDGRPFVYLVFTAADEGV